MISLPYVWHLSSSFLNDQWVRDGVAVGVVVDLSLVAVRWTSSQLAGRAGLVKRTFFNHTEYVWNLVLFKSVKAGFLPLLLNDGVFGVGLQLPRRLRDVHFGGVLHMNRWLPCSRWCLPEEYRGLGWYLHRQCLWTLVPLRPLPSRMLQDVLLPLYRISTRPGSPRRSSGWRCRPWRSRRRRRPRYSQYFSVDDFVDCRITQQVRTVFKQSALVGFSSKIFLGRLLLNFDELELKNFYQTFDKRWLNFDQTLNNFRLTLCYAIFIFTGARGAFFRFRLQTSKIGKEPVFTWISFTPLLY